jgi:hypothetical protein
MGTLFASLVLSNQWPQQQKKEKKKLTLGRLALVVGT